MSDKTKNTKEVQKSRPETDDIRVISQQFYQEMVIGVKKMTMPIPQKQH